MKKDDLFKLNLYEQLNISQTATQSEIGKAYRKKALKVHPDKNPGNSKAEDDFKFLTFILNILNDKQTRESYDLVLNGRKRRCEANERLDDERKKFKNDLEKREEAARRKDEEKKEMKRFETQEKYFRQQVDKIEKENEDLLNEMKRKLLEEQQDVTRIVRTFKWKYKSDEMDNKNRKWSKRMLKAVLFSSVDLKHHERINKRSYKCSFNSKKSPRH
ncbi:hypothetical protein SNEBB_011069 [Seison nebaliae]|nr:hypothetical protein SNEBB_011069 [Seison nebaliae]